MACLIGPYFLWKFELKFNFLLLSCLMALFFFGIGFPPLLVFLVLVELKFSPFRWELKFHFFFLTIETNSISNCKKKIIPLIENLHVKQSQTNAKNFPFFFFGNPNKLYPFNYNFHEK